MNLENTKCIHFTGIKGVAMTSLAIIAKEMGKRISGSDVSEEFPTDTTLERFNIHYATQFSPNNIGKDIDLVIYTGAHQGRNNIEVQTALQNNIPILAHGVALGLFMNGKKQISVAGSHGKTTTSAMIASVLAHAKVDPSYAIGCGEIMHLKTPAHYGVGDYFVAEADEYVTDPTSDPTPRFMWQKPEILVLTNIDFDHPDVYANLDAVKIAFVKFCHNVSPNGVVILNCDDQESMSIKNQIIAPVITYGFGKDADFQARNISFEEGQTHFEVYHRGNMIKTLTIKVPGEHNVHNATAVVAALYTKGISIDLIQEGLAEFRGTKRRFEFIGQKNGKLLYDDYAHHPVEIQSTLRAVKQWFGAKRLVVIFQPHTYSRTKSLLPQFAQSFEAADKIVITDIYASAREMPIAGLTSQSLVDEVAKSQKTIFYAPDRTRVLQYIKANSAPHDLILTMGAGDIYSWLADIFEAL